LGYWVEKVDTARSATIHTNAYLKQLKNSPNDSRSRLEVFALVGSS
jgi:hypothetical protein